MGAQIQNLDFSNRTLLDYFVNYPLKLFLDTLVCLAYTYPDMKKEMLKRKDGSYSQRGLYDNVRAAKGSGKKPTAAMLKQDKKIKAKKK